MLKQVQHDQVITIQHDQVITIQHDQVITIQHDQAEIIFMTYLRKVIPNLFRNLFLRSSL